MTTLDVTSTSAISQAQQAIAKKLFTYYNPPNTVDGTLMPLNAGTTTAGYEWYEGGICWGAVFEYARVSGDGQYSQDVNKGLQAASYGSVGSFLGVDKEINGLIGRWNDDIQWWGLATTTGAELFGANTNIPGGVTYEALAQSRLDQNAQRKYYKSAITNSQAINIGARLYLLTKNQTYIDNSMKIYNWMMSSKIVGSDFAVYDGLLADSTCALSGVQLSYNAGFLAGALAWLYKASGNQDVIKTAESIALKSLQTFSKNGIIADLCEPNCLVYVVSPKGLHVRGLQYVYMYSQNADVKSQIKAALQKSAQSLAQYCDDQWSCNAQSWSGPQIAADVHLQTNALELFNALAATNGVSSSVTNVPAANTIGGAATTSKNGATNALSETWVVVLSFLTFFFAQ
ncbi:hydrolase 76 protein [Boothiomyces macroporosus]|uniref:Mannan endo-1,6-alpha-mannosidase n=1 Tax=Boothiomyces macroporosus TaxID=261099 RepID=A0AAD5Y353_9FUNG|nr:hydrolase 76 protein [Boothiomyces macroporosus]